MISKLKEIIHFMEGIVGLVFIYIKMQKKGNYIFLIHDIGSVVFPLSYLNTARESFIYKKVIVVTRRKYVGICKIFGIEDNEIIVIPEWEKWFIHWALSIFDLKGSSKRRVFHFYTSSHRKRIIKWAQHVKSIMYTPQSLSASYMFDVDPAGPITYGNPYRINISELEKYIRQYDIVKEKSIIIIPSSVSADPFPDQFWHFLAEDLNDLGLKVYTNAYKNNEVIPNTNPIFAPLEFMPALIMYAGYAITVQTGLGDFLHLCNCPCSMIFNYGNNYFRLSMSDYHLYENLSNTEKLKYLSKLELNRYDSSLIGVDPLVFGHSYADVFDSEVKLDDLRKKLLSDVIGFYKIAKHN